MLDSTPVVSAGEGYRLVTAGDSVLVVEFEPRIDPQINARAVALARHVVAHQLPGVRDVVPTFCALAIYFDPCVVARSGLVREIETAMRQVLDEAANSSSSRDVGPTVVVPVHYGGVDGPDLVDVARSVGLSEAEVVRLHAERIYRVYMLGFLPGFAYLGSVDSRIAVPRLASPRAVVPAGSVAIAGEQTGVYPRRSPGGWRIIGRTPLVMFDARRDEPSLLQAGDHVRFEPVEQSGGTRG